MADKVTQEVYLDVNLGFIDEDTRKIKIPNANSASSYTTSDFASLESALKPTIDGTEVNFLVGDRTGADFVGILTVDRVASQKTDFDITN